MSRADLLPDVKHLLFLASPRRKLAFCTSRAPVSGQSCGQAVWAPSLSGTIRFLQLTGTAAPPLPDDHTTRLDDLHGVQGVRE